MRWVSNTKEKRKIEENKQKKEEVQTNIVIINFNN